jgi:hypothetical protein
MAAFGRVDPLGRESNGRGMSNARLVAAGALVALALSGCGSAKDETPLSTTAAPTSATAPTSTVPPTTVPPTTAAPTTTPPPATAPPTTAAPTTPPPATTAAPALMPDVVCMNLQDAQDTIQRAGVFFSRSVDATGRGRHQILDRDWQVVGQQPSPGTPISEGEPVLSVVKYGEQSPCP